MARVPRAGRRRSRHRRVGRTQSRGAPRRAKPRRFVAAAKARRFVAAPETSAHVTGRAVDIGPAAADSWLSRHGAGYGLCQMYANEMWHFELATVPGGECPAMLPDASP